MRHLSGERNHKRACKILRLYCQGLTEDEISDKLKISQQAVNQSLARSIERLKVVAKRL
jgi:DNA-binding NarL/FixJ family response regulator